jgi:hypothetical protein
MPIALADEVKPDEPGAPVPEGAIDPELVKLGRKRVKVGAITALAVAVLCGFFAIRLGPDRRFSRQGDAPRHATAAEVLDGSVPVDSYVALHAEPLVGHAVRAATSRGVAGERVVPVRGTGDRLWLVEPGDAFGDPTPDAYIGRLRRLADLPLAAAVRDFVTANPRPVFATAAEVRRGFASGTLRTVSGDEVHAGVDTEVAFDVVDPGAAIVVASFVPELPDAAAWLAALEAAKLPHTGTPVVERDAVRIELAMPDAVATATARLADAKLYATRVDPVTRHHEMTWAMLAASPPGAFAADGGAIPEAQVDLVGVFVTRTVPDDAYALITGEEPDDYDYVLPISIALGAFALLFAWGFVHAVRRDWLVAK